MGAYIGKELEGQILLLDKEDLEQLQLFVEFLLSKREGGRLTIKKDKKLLEDMEAMPLSIENDFHNREKIYEDLP